MTPRPTWPLLVRRLLAALCMWALFLRLYATLFLVLLVALAIMAFPFLPFVLMAVRK